MVQRRFSLVLARARSLLQRKTLVFSLLAVVLAGTLAVVATRPWAAKPASSSAAEHQRELQSAVDTASGTPRDGRDAGSQGQNSLAAAASKPAGRTQPVEQPVATVSGGRHRHADPATVLPDAKRTGTSANGCIIGYGKQGDQCLPTPGENRAVSCDYVRRYFPHGVQVTGTDSFQLDKNQDQLACGHGDS